ncbi:NACHT domain-containing protein [Kovacikia minuta CCNUW1]|uniref:NACHT domain-containing protein n=1 Tax=Kovacikia minuta TaxID=2931930 RepID=UPI001CC8F11C|nr:NACHT domain-containing protein [Kovacikia minuta]UBF28534.1 NACHT domain-containing protein [Kovacikia minuta CCNUW1]
MSQNPKNSDLQTIFDRIETGKRLGKQDLQILVAAVRSQQVTIATGDRAVAIGGSAAGAVVVTGNGNLVLQGSEAEFLKEALRTALHETKKVQRSRNEQLLLDEVKQEVIARLHQSLFDAVLIELQKQQLFHRVKRPWDAEIKIGARPSLPLPDDSDILEVFDHEEIQGRLLILGAPGAGKTTTQLDLAKALIERAERQPDYPIPVLFSLPSWRDDRQPMTEWLVAELKSKYGVQPRIGRKWLENRKLLPLLDGLDELEVNRQESCVQAINALIQGGCRPQYLVVCSRAEEYTKYETCLQLNGAVCLQPLIASQIRDYLSAIRHPDLWQIIVDDSNLLELSRIPLLLSVVILTYKDIDPETWKQFNSPQELLHYLLDAYVQRMLARSVSRDLYGRQKTPTPKQIRHWLIWLSQQLQRDAQVEFLIEEMQPFILLPSNERKIYIVLAWSIIVLTATLIAALNNGSVFGISGVLISVVIIGANRRQIHTIQPIEVLMWSLDGAKTGLTIGLMIGIGLGTHFGWSLGGSLISAFFYGLVGALLFGLVGALLVGLFYTLSGQLSEPDIETEKFPNQGIWRSFINAGIAGLVSGLVGGLVGFLIFALIGIPASGLLFGLMSGLMSGLIFGGGLACIQHFSLRIILYQGNCIPWNYSRFLTYATARLFLQQIGGRYRFIHRLLQEHFAAMPLEKE